MAVATAIHIRPHSSAGAEPQPASWALRGLVAMAIVTAFWFVGHSVTSSLDIAKREGLDPLSIENRFAVRQSETQTNSVIGFVFLGLVGAACWMRAPRRCLHWNLGLLLCAAAYAGWCFVSITWSIEPSLSLRKEGILVFMLMAAFGLAARFEIEDLLWIALIAVATFVAVGVLAEIRYGTLRPWRGTYRFSGTVDPNDQGLQCALLVLCAALAQWAGRDRPWLRRGLILLGLAGLWFSKSRTTLAAFLVAAALGVVLRARGAQRWLVLTGCLVLACLGGMAYSFLSVSVLKETADVAVMGREKDINTLTGRLPLWREAWKEAKRSAWLGHGYGAYWNSKNVLVYSDMFSWQIPHAHNAYIDQVLAVGGVGLGLYLTWTVASIVTAWRRYETSGRNAYLFAACFLAFTLVHGATESKLPGASLAALVQLTTMAMVMVRRSPSAATSQAPQGRRSVGRLARRPLRTHSAPVRLATPRRAGPFSDAIR